MSAHTTTVLTHSISSHDVFLHCARCLRERGQLIYYSQRQKHCAVCQDEALEPLELRGAEPILPTITQVLADPAASFWIKQTLTSALSRDPVDAANDADLVARLLDKRCREAFDEPLSTAQATEREKPAGLR